MGHTDSQPASLKMGQAVCAVVNYYVAYVESNAVS